MSSSASSSTSGPVSNSRISLPTREALLELAHVRADACISIYLPTSPMGMHKEECRIELHNLIREGLARLEDEEFDKRRLFALSVMLDSVAGAEDFCLQQAESMALLATPEMVRTYRLANNLKPQLEISDRFYLKPLYRALTFPHTAYILALSENAVRVIELCPEAGPEEIKVADMPKNAASSLGLSKITASISGISQEGGKRDPKHRLAVYARKVDEAIRPVLHGCDYPLILAATEPMAAIYRSVSHRCLVGEGIEANADRMPLDELAKLARPILDRHYAAELEQTKGQFEEMADKKRVVTDLGDAARAATWGMISTALVDFDYVATGSISDEGVLSLSDAPGSYGVIDEIVKRAMEGGAKIVAVRKEDMIGESGIAAILRYPLEA